MSSDAPKDKKTNIGLPDFLKEISPSYSWTDYLKRFFYQIIGIYFPATMLFLYIFFFWFAGIGNDPIATQHNISGWPWSLGSNITTVLRLDEGNDVEIVETILFIITIVILGEGINSVTARLAKLSPVTTSISEIIKFGLKNRSFPRESKRAKWPIWLNLTSFPVSFSQFDRYYVSVLEQDKRTLAGKIGWVSFYRNMVAVFAIILILQLILLIASWLHTAIYMNYVFAIAAVALVLFLFGYLAQIKSNQAIFWDAYRRYELRKNLEIRYGDLTVAFGIKDKYKTKALEYILDRWYLAAETTLQTISRYFLTMLEEKYRKLFHCKNEFTSSLTNRAKLRTNYKIEDDIIKIEEKIKNKLTGLYSDWNRGAYERVIANAIDSFEEIERFLEKYDYLNEIEKCEASLPLEEEWKHSPTPNDWKKILGFYVLEYSLRTDAAFVEISRNLSNRGWTIQKDKESVKKKDVSDKDNSSNPASAEEQTRVKSNMKGKIHHFYAVDVKKPKGYYDRMANIIRESSDDYQHAFFAFMDTLKTFNELLSEHKLDRSQKEICFGRLKNIYYLFGDYEYDKARKESEDFFNEIYQTGSAYQSLKSEEGSDARYVIGGSSTLSDNIPEEATIRGITNLTNLQLDVSHVDSNGRTKRFRLIPPDSSLIIMKEGRPGQMVLGKWNVRCIELPNHALPEQIRLHIKWEAPVQQPRRIETDSDEIEEILQQPEL